MGLIVVELVNGGIRYVPLRMEEPRTPVSWARRMMVAVSVIVGFVCLIWRVG